jgi:anti-sigma factor RsiW
MEARPRPGPGSACDDARLRASLELDGELDDLGRLQLRRHLESCAGCARHVADMWAATSLLRSAPPEPYGCGLTGTRLMRSCSTGGGHHWAGAAVAVAALVLATASLPRSEATDTGLRSAAAADARPALVMPLKLPIGQRSAVEDFAAEADPGAPSQARRAPFQQMG